jgi:site-specific DNA-cytosine methylase
LASSAPVCELCGSASRTTTAAESLPGIGPESPAIPTCAPLWATATAHPRTHTPRQVHHGQQLANQVAGQSCPCRCHTSMSSAADSPARISAYAGKGAGIDGERSGLWSEYARLIRELRPRYVVVENVPALLGRGLGRVLGDLAACGYDAEWDCLPASAFGAPHRRDRVWLVAYPAGGRSGTFGQNGTAEARADARLGRAGPALADPSRDAEAGPAPQAGAERERVGAGGEPSGAPVADAEGAAVGTGLREAKREGSGGDDLATAVARGTPGQLNPTWVEWLMGFPLGWTDLQPSGTPSSPRSPSSSAGESSNGRPRPVA